MSDQQIATAAMLAIGIATVAVGLLRALEWVNDWLSRPVIRKESR